MTHDKIGLGDPKFLFPTEDNFSNDGQFYRLFLICSSYRVLKIPGHVTIAKEGFEPDRKVCEQVLFYCISAYPLTLREHFVTTIKSKQTKNSKKPTQNLNEQN